MRLCGSKLTKTLLAVCSGQLCGAYVDSPKRKLWLQYDERSTVESMDTRPRPLPGSVIPAILSVVPMSDPEYYEVHRTVKREVSTEIKSTIFIFFNRRNHRRTCQISDTFQLNYSNEVL